MVIVTVLFVIAGLTTLIWMANWPFGTPLAKELSDEDRRINAEHNRRHHRGVARGLLPILAVIFGIASISLFGGSSSDKPAAIGMGVCSAVCVGLFVASIKMGRRRRSSKRR
ncbi:hypothetical protein [Micromonospora endophytica]|uniref:hypothetical protein n=1 Tax=Micromonospora endophytica TaxID=515350 RepID=UPI0011B36FEC|nr:hypothetical protein [Micromonospora endophytica]BCJ59921.1 hypothetical protein Jiend_33430 [Micromonospora endophytica]